MKIGLIQSCSIGDLIIALPIAQWLQLNGHSVYWPIDTEFYGMMCAAAPDVEFIEVPKPGPELSSAQALYDLPMSLLAPLGCDRIFPLYQHFSHPPPGAINDSYAQSLKFDEYKYAVAGVPFIEKWNLRLRRDKARETALFERLDITRPYILRHQTGSSASAEISLPADWSEAFQVIDITTLTDNPFDWILTIERASRLLMIDSCFANLTEQLNIPVEKYLVLRSISASTPVYANGWRFIRYNAIALAASC